VERRGSADGTFRWLRGKKAKREAYPAGVPGEDREKPYILIWEGKGRWKMNR
jgi:hypothetical protein